MSETCETVEIASPESPGGFRVINKSDYDPKEHTIFGSEQPKPKQITVKRSNK